MSEFLEPSISPEDRTPDGLAVVFDDEDLCFKVIANKVTALHLKPALAPSPVEVQNGAKPKYTVLPDTGSIVFGLEAARSAQGRLQEASSALENGTVRDRYERVGRALAATIALIERPAHDPTTAQIGSKAPIQLPVRAGRT